MGLFGLHSRRLTSFVMAASYTLRSRVTNSKLLEKLMSNISLLEAMNMTYIHTVHFAQRIFHYAGMLERENAISETISNIDYAWRANEHNNFRNSSSVEKSNARSLLLRKVPFIS